MEQGFQKLPDGSLIMRRPQPVQAKPGLLAGLLQRLMPQKPQPAPYWLPQPEAVQAREVAPMPQQAPAAPAGLPAYNGAWGEIEAEALKEQAIADRLGVVSKRILESPAIVEGKWWGGR